MVTIGILNLQLLELLMREFLLELVTLWLLENQGKS